MLLAASQRCSTPLSAAAKASSSFVVAMLSRESNPLEQPTGSW
jgi:hypothetical protein